MLSLLWIAPAVFIVLLLIGRLSNRTITIQQISVPEALAKNGYTSEVASQRLRDALHNFIFHARNSGVSEPIALREDLPDIVVPTLGISLDTIVSSIRTFLPNDSRRNIGGELTANGGRLWLRLRINGRDFYNSPSGVDPENPDELRTAAAPKLLAETQDVVGR